MIFVSGAFVLVTMYYIIMILREIFTKQRRFQTNGIKDIGSILLSVTLISSIFYCLYKAPYSLYYGTSWEMIDEFGPSALINGVVCLVIVIPLFYFYYLLSSFFVKEKHDRPYFIIIVLSIASALGNSIIIFMINQALNRVVNNESRWAAIDSGLYLYVIIGIALFTVSAYVVRKKLISITSEIVYDKRIEIINNILIAPYDKFEALEDGKVHAALNNDTETVSGFVNALVNGLTGVITMITCFIYLGTLNFWGMLFTLIMIGLAVGLFLAVSGRAEKKFELNRDIQNKFFKNINDMIKGFKELYINKNKRRAFSTDIKESCKDYRDSRVEGEYTFVGVSILGEIIYIFAIAVVVFIFPLIFPNLQNTTLQNYVLVFLYMGGIVNTEIYLVPGIMRVLVSWRRITSFIKEISFNEVSKQEVESINSSTLEINLDNIKFAYKNENGEKFEVGPINCEFKSGEIIFISGGNGSGKSTLAKLLTGLYEPDEGQITVNGLQVDRETLASNFSIIFSDFHLFDRMYGIDFKKKSEEINHYLDVLRIRDKVQICDGVFNTVKLSTGQRKRLALLITYLEDRPVYLFDEWAADQDPEYRKFFYMVLLPELKARGKIIIAITHDERYFNEADKHIKMETGHIVSYEKSQSLSASGAEIRL